MCHHFYQKCINGYQVKNTSYIKAIADKPQSLSGRTEACFILSCRFPLIKPPAIHSDNCLLTQLYRLSIFR